MTQPAKPFTAQELDQLAERTLEHYRERAEDFREGTRDHDVSQNIAALLEHIVGPPPFTVLDFGCGPGRDLAAFTQLGHRAIGLEGAYEMSNRLRCPSRESTRRTMSDGFKLRSAH